jgi:hypothetical protein
MTADIEINLVFFKTSEISFARRQHNVNTKTARLANDSGNKAGGKPNETRKRCVDGCDNAAKKTIPAVITPMESFLILAELKARVTRASAFSSMFIYPLPRNLGLKVIPKCRLSRNRRKIIPTPQVTILNYN